MRSSDITLERFRDLEGTDVYDPNGEKIGAVDEVFYDNATGVPEWISVGTGFLRLNKAVVPIEGIQFAGDKIVVPFEKERVKASPDVGTDEITPEQERELCSYYGITHGTGSLHLQRWAIVEPMPEGTWTTRRTA